MLFAFFACSLTACAQPQAAGDPTGDATQPGGDEDQAAVVAALVTNDAANGAGDMGALLEDAKLTVDDSTVDGVMAHLEATLPAEIEQLAASNEAAAVSVEAIAGATAELARTSKVLGALTVSLQNDCDGGPSGAELAQLDLPAWQRSWCGTLDGAEVRSGLLVINGQAAGAIALAITVTEAGGEERLYALGGYGGAIAAVGGAFAGVTNIYDVTAPAAASGLPQPISTFELAAAGLPGASGAQAAIVSRDRDRAALALFAQGADARHVVAAWADTAAVQPCTATGGACVQQLIDQFDAVGFAATYVFLPNDPCDAWGIAVSDDNVDEGAAAWKWNAADAQACS